MLWIVYTLEGICSVVLQVWYRGWLKMQDVKMADHQNCRAWNCRTWKWRTKNDARARAWNGMLNLYSVYSASNVRRLCALLCPAISFLHFHVLQFHALQIGPSISRPSFSRAAFSAPPDIDVALCSSGAIFAAVCSDFSRVVFSQL